MWDETAAEERRVYEQREQEDKARYDREMAAYEKVQAAGSSSSASAKKKTKA